MRWGARLNDATAVDVLVASLTDPFDEVHMGNTAENVARKWGITREDQDELAVESHRRALDAIEKGKFKGQIVPVELKSRTGSTFFTTDESPRSDATIENLARLKPAFDKAGTITAGNSSSINDGAAAVVLMERHAAEERGLKPMARLVDYSVAGVEPGVMGIGPVPAVRKLYKRTGLSNDKIDVIRGQRSLRGPGPRGSTRPGPAAGEDQPQRERHFFRPSAGRNGRNRHREGVARTAADWRQVCAGDHVYRRRPRHCCHF